MRAVQAWFNSSRGKPIEVLTDDNLPEQLADGSVIHRGRYGTRRTGAARPVREWAGAGLDPSRSPLNTPAAMISAAATARPASS